MESQRKHSVLLVEDEESLRETILLNLQLEGYHAIAEQDGRQALQRALSEVFDVIILDVMLPHVDGYTICKTLREKGNATPILFLTAKGGEHDRVEGLKLGADDYLSKPFNLEEFLLRVRNLATRFDRRDNASTPATFQIGSNTVFFDQYEMLLQDGTKQPLSQKEVELLRFLIAHPNRVVSRNEMLDQVWGKNEYPSSRTIDNFILAFRKYFEPDPAQPVHFISIRGVGYRFDP